MAASFSIVPNRLGFCGPQVSREQKILREFIRTGEKRSEARKILGKFEGAYGYFCLIARKNEIKDPFQEKVVEAYWIGNNLLDNVSVRDIRGMIKKKFTRPGLLSQEEANRRIEKVPFGARPHHSFHVFILGTVTGTIDLNTVNLKDICRVGWGKVREIDERFENKVVVDYQPAVKEGTIKLGEFEKKELFWDKEVVSQLKAGDYVAFHWGVVSCLLNRRQIINLKKYTEITLNLL